MKRVLFLCVGNSCRSQMAEGFLRHFGRENVRAASAGTEPAESISSKAVEVMRERGIDISSQHPKLVTTEMVEGADICISMGCGVADSCPANIYGRFVDWGIEDPYGHDLDKYREVRDLIEGKVRKLLEEMGL